MTLSKKVNEYKFIIPGLDVRVLDALGDCTITLEQTFQLTVQL